MFSMHLKTFKSLALALAFCLLAATPALALLENLLGKPEVNEAERRETIERIEGIQEKLQLLQEKLKALERRKAASKAAELAGSGKLPVDPVHINWTPVDATTIAPGDFGHYTYLLFMGEMTDAAAIGALEDFILTIETLPASDIPATLGNRFLVPVEKPQSTVNLGRQPYDFTLNDAYLRRLGLGSDLAKGPVLVTADQPIDPYGVGAVPAFLAVGLGRQTPQQALALAKIWHRQEKEAIAPSGHPSSALFWQLLEGSGPVQVERSGGHLQVLLPQR